MINNLFEFEKEIIRKIYLYIKDEGKEGYIPQPIFLVGASGAGKSTIFKFLTKYIEEKGKSKRIKYLDGKQYFESHEIIRDFEGVEYDGSQSLNKNKGNGIILIDDIDIYFKRSSYEDQYLLRNYLNIEGAPLLIASVSSIDNNLADYKAPFFEGVRLVYIPPLDYLNVDDIMNQSEDYKERILSLMKYLPPVIRSLEISSAIVAQSKNSDEDVSALIKHMAPQYRNMLQSLPINSQKILVSLANSEMPLSLSALRERTGINSGVLSTYLRQLVKSGDIRKTNQKKRGEPYELRDQLFKTWLSNE